MSPADDHSLPSLLSRIHGDAVRLARPVRLMEVCGTHTMVAFRSGLRSLLPENVALVSGPGCPVCVTPTAFVDTAIALSQLSGVRLATYGDLVRVPGSDSSLERERARGARVEVVYSALDALELARREPGATIVFLAVGFETTAPGTAQTLRSARDEGLPNFTVLSACKTMPRAMELLVKDAKANVDGFLCPGHVSVVTGASTFSSLAAEHGIPCVVAGFEPQDIVEGIALLLAQLAGQRSEVEIQYGRAVTWEGNRQAQAAIAEVFEECDSEWRGLGMIPGSGLAIREAYSAHDAAHRFQVQVGSGHDPAGCRCGEVLRGHIRPPECPLFGRSCTPRLPRGACMVSSEGACAAYARYGSGTIGE
jgi:hydrogenase expression/formation protein HypD